MRKSRSSWSVLLTAEADQTSLAASGRHGKSGFSVRILPEELHELVSAGISNAIEHAISNGLMKTRDSTVGYLEKVFMDEICGPSPQIRYFIRNHEFILSSSVRMSASSGSLRSAQKQYEQDVYDFSRDLGFPMNGAEKWVLKARDVWSGKGYDSPDVEETDHVSSRKEMPHHSSEEALLEMFRLKSAPVEHFDQEPRDIASRGTEGKFSPELESTLVPDILQAPVSAGESTFKNNDEIEDVSQIMTENKVKHANQLQQRQLQNWKDSGRHLEDDGNMQATIKNSVPSDESSVGNLVDLHDEFNRVEAVVEEKGDKATKNTAQKAAKKAHREQLEIEMELAKFSVKLKSALKAHNRSLGDSERELKTTETFEEGLQFEQLEEDKIKHQRQKRKTRKRKRDHGLPPQSDVQLKEYHKHNIAIADSDPEDANPRKSKTKKGGSQCSPFFQRTSGSKAGEDNASIQAKRLLESQRNNDDSLLKARPSVGFQAPMIQST